MALMRLTSGRRWPVAAAARGLVRARVPAMLPGSSAPCWRFCSVASKNSTKYVVVGMSGGVDSSVAALLLKQQGYNVTGVYMKNWDSSDELGTEVCPHDAEFRDVEQVCKQIGIQAPQQVNLVHSYWNSVFSPCLEHFEEGLTPNPDILCNREIKFKAFLEYADSIGADFVATGHYARLQHNTSNTHVDCVPQLFAASDVSKDQSYFLSNVSGKAFAKVLFPLGNLQKSEVRQIASDAGLSTAEKKDSVGICFIGKRNFGDFIHQYIPRQEGYFYTVDGQQMHMHNGFTSYTVGQGARIQGMKDKWFVVGKHKFDHSVIVAAGTKHPALFSDSLFANSSDFNWISGEMPAELRDTGKLRCLYRVRYRQELGECVVSIVSNAEAKANASTLHDWELTMIGSVGAKTSVAHEDEEQVATTSYLRVDFDAPQRGVTPQQALVLYRNDGLCYGGGPIAVAGKTYHEHNKPLNPNVYDWRQQ